MCPVLCILPFVVITGILYGANWLIRRKRVSPLNKAVLITGCDRGFGETLATKLALEGFTVYAGCLSIESDGASHLRSQARVTVLQLDVTDQGSVDSASRQLTTQLGECGLWAVVNNAGIAVFAENEWCTMDAYERVVGVNLMGTIRVTKAFLPLVRRARGRVVNISSLAGRIALPGFTAYSASKFGIIGFSDSLRREMFKFGVKVITIEPKLYRTAIADGEFHVQTNGRMWEATSDDVKVDYGDTYFRAFLDNMLKNLKRSSRKTYKVIDDLIHAVGSVYPYTRYNPDLKMQLSSDSFMISPNFVQDSILNYMLKVPCTPFAMRAKKTV